MREEGTKKTIIWETNSEPPRNYIWIKSDGIAYEWDESIREWVPSEDLYTSDDGSSVSTIISKTTAEWNAMTGYIPRKGEIIVYTDYKHVEVEGELVDVPGIKIGSGNAYVQDLMFVGDSQMDIEFRHHVEDTTIHTNSEEKDFWNGKVSIDESKLGSEILFFKTN